MKNLFHIAIDSQFYNSAGIRKGFENNGYKVDQFNYQSERYDHGTEQMRQRCLDMASLSGADLVFLHCQNPDAFDEGTVKMLSKLAPVIHYSFDVREDISWYKKLAPHVALTLFACREDVNSCLADGVINVNYLPSTVDFDVYKPILHFQQKIKVPEIVFIGNNTVGSNLKYPLAQHRQDMIKFMENEFGDKFKAYGMGQSGGQTTLEQELRIYNSCKIAITHNNFQRAGYCSDRDFRSAGCGALTVHHYFDGVKQMFGWPAAVWTDFSDLSYICKYFLDEKHDKERTELSIRELTLVTEKHTWTERIKQMLMMIGEQKDERSVATKV